MDVITQTAQIAAAWPYPATLYVATLPSGGRLAIEAHATFGEIAIIVLLIILVGAEFVRLARHVNAD